jgi:hypothetical protein
MTRSEWNRAASIDYLRRSRWNSSRKFRLYGCACVRRFWELLDDDRCRNGVEVSERFADGLATDRQLDDAHAASHKAKQEWARKMKKSPVPWTVTDEKRRDAMIAALRMATRKGPAWKAAEQAVAYAKLAARRAQKQEDKYQTLLLREIFHPFTIAVDPDWLHCNDRTAAKLAQVIYDERAFERLPIMADALEEAGCTDAEVLGHLHGPGPHVRGCWALDLLLAKE